MDSSGGKSDFETDQNKAGGIQTADQFRAR